MNAVSETIVKSTEISPAPPSDLVESSVEAATAAAVEATPSKAEKVAGILRMIANDLVGKGLDPASHPAINKTAAEHDPAEIKQLLSYIQETVEATAEAVAPFLAVVDEAKAIIHAEFAVDLSKPRSAPATKASAPVKASKPAKAEKAIKEVKAKAEKPPKEVVAKEPKPEAPIVAVETLVVPSSEHVLPEAAKRADLLPKPENFILEVGPVRTGNNVHQVDPSRPQACTPVLPNLSLLASSGNPYPLKADETVKTAERYQSFVGISHFTYNHFSSVEQMSGRPEKETVESILTMAGVKDSAETRGAIQDTLRDLCLYGLATQRIQGNRRLFSTLAA